MENEGECSGCSHHLVSADGPLALNRMEILEAYKVKGALVMFLTNFDTPMRIIQQAKPPFLDAFLLVTTASLREISNTSPSPQINNASPQSNALTCWDWNSAYSLRPCRSFLD